MKKYSIGCEILFIIIMMVIMIGVVIYIINNYHGIIEDNRVEEHISVED